MCFEFFRKRVACIYAKCTYQESFIMILFDIFMNIYTIIYVYIYISLEIHQTSQGEPSKMTVRSMLRSKRLHRSLSTNSQTRSKF